MNDSHNSGSRFWNGILYLLLVGVAVGIFLLVQRAAIGIDAPPPAPDASPFDPGSARKKTTLFCTS